MNVFVYVIGSSDQVVKIGFSYSVQQRLASLQTSSPEPLRCFHALQVPVALARKVESRAHKALASHRLSGEWFAVDVATATAAIDEGLKQARAEASDRALLDDRELSLLARVASIHPWAAEALQHYRDCAFGLGGLDKVAVLDEVVLRKAGMNAATAFHMVVFERRRLESFFYRDPRSLKNAQKSLIKGINALAQHYAAEREQALLDNFSENAA